MRRALPWTIALIVMAVATLCGAALAGIQPPPTTNPAPGLKSFTFAIAGDNRGGVPIRQPEVFKRIIRELEILRPALVLGLGDLILGYESEEQMVRAEWDEFVRVVNQTQVPYYPIVGNHDVWDDQSLQIWNELFGPTYFSFDYGNCHFVCLDSNPGVEGKPFPDSQMAWFEQDLANHQDAEHIIALMHVPFWSYDDDRPGWEQEVQPLLVKYGVDLVVGGHTHGYEYDTPAGIPHIVTGGAGAELDANEATGGFYHYLLINVEGPELRVAVIRPGSIEPPNFVIPSDREAFDTIYEDLLPPAVVRVDSKGLEDGAIVLTLRNPLDEVQAGEVQWVVPGANWVIYPQAQEYSLAPGGTTELRFTAALSDPKRANPPPYYTTTAPVHPGKTFAFKRGLGVEKSVVCPRAQTPPTIDGVLEENEWQGAAVLDNFALQNGSASTSAPRVFLSHDDANLYLGTRVSVPPARRDRALILLDNDTDHSVFYQVQLVASGTVKVGRADDVAGTEEYWELPQPGRVSVDEQGWGAEVAIPLAHLGIAPPISGARLRLNAWALCNQDGRYTMAVWAWLPGIEFGETRSGAVDLE